MRRSRAGCHFIVCSTLLLSLTHVAPTVALAQALSADARALATEQQMTDDERFAMIVSVMGSNILFPARDKRIPEGTAMSAGYIPGVPRLGVPALQSTDASLGVTNPG
jgi:beta-glucosidase